MVFLLFVFKCNILIQMIRYRLPEKYNSCFFHSLFKYSFIFLWLTYFSFGLVIFFSHIGYIQRHSIPVTCFLNVSFSSEILGKDFPKKTNSFIFILFLNMIFFSMTKIFSFGLVIFLTNRKHPFHLPTVGFCMWLLQLSIPIAQMRLILGDDHTAIIWTQ